MTPMTNEDVQIVGRALLRNFPEFIQLAMIEDPDFRASLGFRLNGTLSLGDEPVQFDRGDFRAATIAALEDQHAEAPLADAKGDEWRVAAEDHQGRTALRLTSGERVMLIYDTPGLRPTAEARLADFAVSLKAVGLPPNALVKWRSILAERRLDNDELRELEEAFASTIVSVRDRIGALLGASISVEGLVPSNREYWENLCGGGVAPTLEALAEEVMPGHVSSLVAWDALEGAKQALLLAGHATLLQGAKLADLPSDVMVALLDWAVSSGDLIAKVAAIEVSLEALDRNAALGEPLAKLVTEVLELSTDDKDGPLQLLSGLIALVEGQLSLLKVLEDWPPFRRRQAVVAQASLVARLWGTTPGVASFTDWATDARGSRFYLQVLVDQRVEPRWSPEYISRSQLKNELIGRLHNAAERHSDALADGPLRDLLLGDGELSLRRKLEFPGAFLPGPMEGAPPATPLKLPEGFEAIVEASLNVDQLEHRSVAALVNLRGLFAIGDDKIERATALIRKAGYRLPTNDDDGVERTMLAGLADLAAISRSTSLADDLRIMARRRRLDKAPTSYFPDLAMAMTAAAAHVDERGWARFAGEWVEELAFSVKDPGQALQLLEALEGLCAISPLLRGGLGSSIAALQSFLQI
jgi:hypothetical protein